MFNTKVFTRNVALAGAVTLLLASSAFAQNGYYPRSNDRAANRGYANRVVEGTVASVAPARNGERIRLTNGMDLIVPNSVISMNQGRRYQTSLLQPGDVVRMTVYSREGDGRDAQVRAFELLRSSAGYNGNGYNNDRSLTGTVVSFDRRNNVLVLQTERGRTVNVDVRSYDGRFRRGDRVSISGRMDRDSGTFIAVGVRVGGR
jgi:ribosomal protein S1